ncbi:DUF1361 domain-containing protein [Prosthecobacter sp.]|uniref:DUF1361 domain-containing protein n=1 Tax=Prosthecobacter sp. TaxID=1965333 RepID=UPI003783D46D
MKSRVFLLNLLACLWCFLVLKMRSFIVGHDYYTFMVWNLFLAAIPLGLSLALRRMNRLLPALPLLGMWLLFFPNAPYVLTDLMHLHKNPWGPVWLDLLMLLSFALVSLWYGFQSLHIVQHWFARKFSHTTAWCVSLGSLGLSGFGVYLGRFDRWNSWDLVHRPVSLLSRIASYILHPLAHTRTWGFTLGFGTLLILAYLFWFSSAPAAAESRKSE